MVLQLIRNAVREQRHRFNTFDDESSDCFGLYKTFAAMFCIHYDARWWTDWTLWNVYRLLPILVNVSYVYKAYRLLSHLDTDDDNTALAIATSYIWGSSVGTLRIALMEVRYSSLSTMMNFLNARTYRRNDVQAHSQRATLFVYNNRIILALAGTILLEGVGFLTTQVFTKEIFMLQIGGRIVSSTAVQIAYGWLSLVWGFTTMLSFGMMYIIMNTFELEMQILLRAISNLESAPVQHQGTSRNSYQSSHHQPSLEEQKTFWFKLQQELNMHISRHVDILDNLNEFSQIVGPFSFLQYYGTFGLIAMCCFIFSIEGLSSNGAIYILFATLLVVESFFICRGIEKINDLNEAIGQALYSEFDWVRLLQYSDDCRSQYRNVRHSLLLVIGRSQKGFQCSYGGLGSISMERFSQLMQKSYTLLTIMLQFAGDE